MLGKLQASEADAWACHRWFVSGYSGHLLNCCLCCPCRFGRMPTYLIATVAFIGASLGCVFAPNAEVLVAFRALQGAGGEEGLAAEAN